MKNGLLDFAARLVLGIESAEQAVEVAANALADGADSKHLVALAVLEQPRIEEVRPILEKALRELGEEVPNIESAALWLARKEAVRMLSHELSPHEGSARIWEIARRAGRNGIALLDPFIYASSEWDDRPEDRPILEGGMLRAAQDLVDATAAQFER